tara:strand:- start:1658 stop:1954 length:297 start_codon:yes stop_codon:yes gene_type:complete
MRARLANAEMCFLGKAASPLVFSLGFIKSADRRAFKKKKTKKKTTEKKKLKLKKKKKKSSRFSVRVCVLLSFSFSLFSLLLQKRQQRSSESSENSTRF